MPEFVEKHRASVRVCLPGQDPVDGQIALGPLSRTRQGSETILELLNTPQRVVPLMLPEFQTVLLVTRLNIDWVLAGAGVDVDLVCPRSYIVSREESVHVTFSDGRTIDGMIQMELPEGMNRASDFLNCPDEFFPMRTRIGIVIVNKTRIRDTRVHSASPQAIPTAHET
jgi:hypothetical protein